MTALLLFACGFILGGLFAVTVLSFFIVGTDE